MPLQTSTTSQQQQQQQQLIQEPPQQQPLSLCKPSADKTIVIHTSKPPVVRGQAAAPGQAPGGGQVLSDHMDMARPPHENPEYSGSGARPILPANSPAYATIISSNGTPLQWTGPDGPLVPVPETPGVARPVTSVSTVPGPTGVSPVSGAPMHAVPIAIPITTFTIASSQHVSCS